MKTATKAMIPAALIVASIMSGPVFAQTQWALDTVLATGANSSGIALTPDGSRAVVTLNTVPGMVKLIETSGYTITPIDLSSVGNYANGVAITPDGTTALVATTNKIAVVDLSTHSVRGNFAAPCVGTTLYGLAVTPNGLNAIFPDLSSGCTQQGLRSMDAANPSGSTFNAVNTSGVLYSIAITPDSLSAIVTTFTSDRPKKVSLSAFAAQNIAGFTGSYAVAAFHHSNEALIQGDSLKRVSLVSNAPTHVLSDIYSTALQGIAITADDRYAFVVGSFQKVVVDLSTNTVIQTFSAGGTGVAVMPDGSKFFVTDSYNGTTRVYKKVVSTGIVDQRGGSEAPEAYELMQSYPNPFNPSTTIRYAVPIRSHVTLTVFNTLGQAVAGLVNGDIDAGYHEVKFNAVNLASGVYYYRLTAGDFVQTRTFSLVK
jgi:hypothetical protein